MINRTEVINGLIQKNGYKSYLEIGLGNGANFKAIKCENKVGVDPNVITLVAFQNANIEPILSDDFFESNKNKFDIIFIDGLHHAEQVQRDIVNAYNCLNANGVILIHDVKPLSEDCQKVPRIQDSWTGDTWRAWYGLKKAYPKLKIDYIDERVGLGIIYKSKAKIKAGFVDNETTYQEYDEAKGWNV